MVHATDRTASGIVAGILALALAACSAATDERRDLAEVTSPAPGARVTTSLRVAGRAPGYWFFEAVMPVEVVTAAGVTIVDSYVEARGEWMVAGPVRFEKTFQLPAVSSATAATLVIRRNNASGLPQHDAEHRVAITLVPGDNDSSGGSPGDNDHKRGGRTRLAGSMPAESA